jgi:hypothetical protein
MKRIVSLLLALSSVAFGIDKFGGNTDLNGSYSLKVNVGGTSTEALKINGANGNTTIGPSAGSSTTTIQSGGNTILSLQSQSSTAGINFSRNGASAGGFGLEVSGNGSLGNLSFYNGTNLAPGSNLLGSIGQTGDWNFGPTATNVTHLARGSLNVAGVGSGGGKLTIIPPTGIGAQSEGLEIQRSSVLSTQRLNISNNAGISTFVSQAGAANGSYDFKLNNGTTTTTAASISSTGIFSAFSGIQLLTSGGTPSTLNYYEEGDVNINITGGSSGTSYSSGGSLVRFRRIGKLVTVSMQGTSSVTTASTEGVITFSPWPARITPASDKRTSITFINVTNRLGYADIRSGAIMVIGGVDNVSCSSGVVCGFALGNTNFSYILD